MVTLGLFSSEQPSAGTKEQLFPSEREDMWLPAGHKLHRSLKLCYTSFSSLFSCLLGPVGMWFCLLCEVLSLRKSKSSLLWVLRGRRFPFLHRDLCLPQPSSFCCDVFQVLSADLTSDPSLALIRYHWDMLSLSFACSQVLILSLLWSFMINWGPTWIAH